MALSHFTRIGNALHLPVQSLGDFMRRVLLSIVVVACWSVQAFAWNLFGHEMVAYIDWQQMTPEQRQHYSAILTAIPHYSQELDEPAGPEHDMHVFMKAATWPDLIRLPQFPDEAGDSHPTWHYINEPINPTHMPATQPETKQTTTQPTNAIQALGQETRILNDPSADPIARAKALCWVRHVVGDLHQPLHCVSLFDSDFPQGDHGGNSIRLGGSDAVRNLHILWDDILGQHGDLEAVAKTANESTQQYATAVAKQAQDIDAQNWVLEGQKLAVSVVYEGLELNGAGELLTDVNRTSVSPDRNYLRRARDTARRQAVLAGQRLARYIK